MTGVTDTPRSTQQSFWDSLPQPKGHINDFENIFSQEEVSVLDSALVQFEKKTTIQIAVITFDSTMTTSGSLPALTLKIANHWGIGQKEKNNGVMIGISKFYRQMRIQNGLGISKILTDAETNTIIDTAFIPGYRQANYFEGTFNGLKALMAILEKRSK